MNKLFCMLLAICLVYGCASTFEPDDPIPANMKEPWGAVVAEHKMTPYDGLDDCSKVNPFIRYFDCASLTQNDPDPE